MASKITIVLLLVAFVVGTQALSPLPCNRAPCPPIAPCAPGFEGTDLNGCCPKCLQGENERCGGPFGAYGTCGGTLACRKDFNDFNAEGVCAPGIPEGGDCGSFFIGQQAMCQLDLTCKANPTSRNGICSKHF